MSKQPTSEKTRVTVVPGDGIGPEIVRATRRIVDASGAPIAWEEAEAGATVFRRGLASGVPKETIDSIASTRIALKGPLETPVGHGEKSANVTLRKFFETYANVRPVQELSGVPTPFQGRGIDLVVVRENIEDLYAGIEHMQTPGVAQCLKLISRKGSEKIMRFAFEFARSEGRRTVHCATKANIMKLTEGLFKKTFEDVAKEYPEITAEHIIVDNCAHLLVRQPERFDVIVTTNMNGDILSDLTSGLNGGLGFAPSANLGSNVAMFEAVHGTGPSIAGQDVANPTALLLSAVMLLRHVGHFAEGDAVQQALLVTLASGVHTPDVGRDEKTVGTSAFADAVIGNLGRTLDGYRERPRQPMRLPQVSSAVDFGIAPARRRVVGVDVFVESGEAAETVGKRLEALAPSCHLRLLMVSNRGTVVYPPTGGFTDLVDHWRCRFVAADEGAEVPDSDVLAILGRVGESFRWMHVEKLNEFDGVPGFTKAQGQS